MIKKITVGWLDRPDYTDGGCWALFAGNGHLIATMATYGKNATAKATADALADAFNRADSAAEALHNCKVLITALTGPDDAIANATIAEANAAMA